MTKLIMAAIFLMMGFNAFAGAENSGNPDEKFKAVQVKFSDILTPDEVADFFDRMQLPPQIAAHFAFIEGGRGLYESETGIRHYKALYNIVDDKKVSAQEPVPAGRNVRYADSSERKARIVWYAAGLNRSKEDIFLTYIHELVRLSHTESGNNRGSSQSATLFVGALDPLFSVLLKSIDDMEKMDAREGLTEKFKTKKISDVVKKSVEDGFSKQKKSSRLNCPGTELNGRVLTKYLEPTLHSSDSSLPSILERFDNFENSAKPYGKLREVYSGRVAGESIPRLVADLCYREFPVKTLGMSRDSKNVFLNLSSNQKVTIVFDSIANVWKMNWSWKRPVYYPISTFYEGSKHHREFGIEHELGLNEYGEMTYLRGGVWRVMDTGQVLFMHGTTDNVFANVKDANIFN